MGVRTVKWVSFARASFQNVGLHDGTNSLSEKLHFIWWLQCRSVARAGGWCVLRWVTGGLVTRSLIVKLILVEVRRYKRHVCRSRLTRY